MVSPVTAFICVCTKPSSHGTRNCRQDTTLASLVAQQSTSQRSNGTVAKAFVRLIKTITDG